MASLQLAILAMAALLSPAQQDQETLREKYEQKLNDAWLEKADWQTDYDKARELSKDSGKPIFGYFTRSYAF